METLRCTILQGALAVNDTVEIPTLKVGLDGPPRRETGPHGAGDGGSSQVERNSGGGGGGGGGGVEDVSCVFMGRIRRTRVDWQNGSRLM